MTNNVPTITIKAQGAVPKQRKQRRRKPKQPKQTNNQPTNQPTQQTFAIQSKRTKQRARNQTKSIARGFGRLEAISSMSSQARRCALAAMLPYNSEPVRVRTQSGVINSSTAVARHFEYYDIDTRALMWSAENQNPSCGILPNGQLVWGDLKTSFNIVSILDARLMAIVPYRSEVSYPRTLSIEYGTNTFVNVQSPYPGTIVIQTSTPFNNGLGQLYDVVYVNDRSPLWLEPVDFFPINGTNGSLSYGNLHPVLDYEDGRYVWIDAPDPENSNIVDDTTYSLITISLYMTASLEVVDMVEGSTSTGQSSLKLVAQRLPSDANLSDGFLTGNFQVLAGPNTNTAHIAVPCSGYYRIGLQGYFHIPTPSPNTFFNLDDVVVGFKIGKNINVVSRHLLNTNLITVPLNRRVYCTEQTYSGSMLVKNTTPLMSKGGVIYGNAITSDESWYSLTSQGVEIRSLTTDNATKYQGDLSNGAYGWHRNQYLGFRTCDDQSRYAMTTQVSSSQPASCLRSYSISRKSANFNERIRAMNIFTIVPPTATQLFGTITSPLSQPATLTLQMTVMLEYTTENQTPIVDSKALNKDAVEEMWGMLAQVNSFSENPLHMAQFMNAVKHAVGRMSAYYGENRSAFQSLFTAISSFGGPIAGLIGKAGLAADVAYGAL